MYALVPFEFYAQNIKGLCVSCDGKEQMSCAPRKRENQFEILQK